MCASDFFDIFNNLLLLIKTNNKEEAETEKMRTGAI